MVDCIPLIAELVGALPKVIKASDKDDKVAKGR